MEIVIVLAVIALVVILISSNRQPLSPLDELRKIPLSALAENELKKTIQRLETGDAYASWLIGGYYESGKVFTPQGDAPFPKNKAKALWWKIKSAEDGCDMAQYNLGRMYYFGDGETDNLVERNYVEALKWFGRAAKNGEFYSLGALGEVYFNGDGVQQDYKMAFDWFIQSVNHPFAKQYGIYEGGLRIGEMYASGRGVDKDLIQAYKWMTIAGRDPEIHHEYPLKGKLSAAEKEKAEFLVKEWRSLSKA